MNAEIITVGTELLLGDIVNTNSQFLSRELAAYGIGMLYQSTVGDNIDRLGEVLRLAMGRSDLVLLTGGLGPTQDDLTRETVADVLGLPLVPDEESLRRIEEYFRNTGREMTENNKKQAMLPEGCIVFPNDHGTAPGCAVERYGQSILLLPGPPRELIPMFNDYVAPYLSRFSGGTIYSQTVGVFGLSESAVAERLADLVCGENPTVAPYAKEGEVVLRVTAHAENREAARAMCAPVTEEIRKRLGVNVYGVDAGSLQKAVVSLLKEKGLQIATAESCTAGLLSTRITEVPGASAVFECGVAAYSKEIKHNVLGVPESLLEEHGAVSPEVACAMAMGVRRVSGAKLGVGITGVAGPEPSEDKPVGTVYIALADEKRVWVKQIVAGHGEGDRDYIRHLATSNALDLVRRYLEALPTVMAGGELIEEPEADMPAVIPSAAPAPVHSRRLKIAGIVVGAALVLTTLLLLLYFYVITPYLNEQQFAHLRELYDRSGTGSDNIIASGDYPEGMLAKFGALYDANADIRGWIHIPDTEIHYPVVQSQIDGYYSSRNFYKKPSSYGVPYFSNTARIYSPSEVNRNLVIFGNNTNNRQMFSQLTEYTHLEFLQAHPIVQMDTLYRNADWKVFAVMAVSTLDAHPGNFEYDVNRFDDEAAFLRFVSEIRDRSLFDTPTTVGEGDNLLMLSTAAEEEFGFPGARLVVVARQTRSDEEAGNDLSAAKVNRDVVMPEIWRQLNEPGVTAAPSTASDPSQVTTTAQSDTADTTGDGTSEDSTASLVTTSDTPPSSTGNGGGTTTTTTLPPTATDPGEVTIPPVTEPTDPPVPPPPVEEDGTVAGSLPESLYMARFKVSVMQGGEEYERLEPTTREELQTALSRVVKQELGSASTMQVSTEAQKAQAVASYSFAIASGAPLSIPYKPFDPEADPTDKKIYDAVGEVLGVKILRAGQSELAQQVISTPYFAFSSGYTSNSDKVWGGFLPWCRSVESRYDNPEWLAGLGKSYTSTLTISRVDLFEKVKGYMMTAKNADEVPEAQFQIPDGQAPLQVRSTDGDGGYVYETNFYYVKDGQTRYLTGNDFRNAIGTTVMRSHSFEVTNYTNGTLTLTVKGHGHGVGLSQMGAVGYASEAGWNYIQILHHYYSITDDSEHQIVRPVW